jgi:hypothetical protein
MCVCMYVLLFRVHYSKELANDVKLRFGMSECVLEFVG